LTEVLDVIHRYKQPGDIVVVSVHWGGNWSRQIDEGQRQFAHGLIDGGVDLIHGHSSHHVRPLEVYRDRLILYGCGDLLNDYSFELYGGKRMPSRLKTYRPELEIAYFLDLNSEGALEALTMVPLHLRCLELGKASLEESTWLADAVCEGEFGASLADALEIGTTLTLRHR
jgi:poly-gamma-glutamate synthesis protein (capsule biosynthesis protein)